ESTCDISPSDLCLMLDGEFGGFLVIFSSLEDEYFESTRGDDKICWHNREKLLIITLNAGCFAKNALHGLC
ncbi:MAG: hypothetical protein RR250_03415, partial [Akkermansia sp.]